jgi:hypothetical protein
MKKRTKDGTLGILIAVFILAVLSCGYQQQKIDQLTDEYDTLVNANAGLVQMIKDGHHDDRPPLDIWIPGINARACRSAAAYSVRAGQNVRPPAPATTGSPRSATAPTAADFWRNADWQLRITPNCRGKPSAFCDPGGSHACAEVSCLSATV